ncbi:MAG: helix-turn-helix domain-containing protein [Bacteroidota bacterium]
MKRTEPLIFLYAKPSLFTHLIMFSVSRELLRSTCCNIIHFLKIAHIWAFNFFTIRGILNVQNISNNEFLIALGKRIRQLRKHKKMTQEELGFLIGNSGKQIGRIERGENNVTTSMIYAISKSLNIPLKEIFDFDVTVHKSKK